MSTITKEIEKAVHQFEKDGRDICWAVFERDERLDYGKLLKEAHDLVNNKRIGTCSAIEVPIQEVGEYELVLTLKLK